ncbi:MAG TPA: serine hydrolase domain-containing protein [Magnetospirillaceae bacterium]|jgi:CubicO group peptidase (beta-lactamase class C family)
MTRDAGRQSPIIDGAVDSRFEAVRAAFADNFARGEEVGASCAVVIDGRLVVDLWGGHLDATGGATWNRETIVNMMSVAKGIAALVVHMLVERGQLDLDRPVAAYWPEFAQAGKETVLVRHLLDHRAGLEVLAEPLWPGSVYEWNVMIGALERQAPLHEPGTFPAYHTVTMSFLVGEIVRRVTGKSYGRVLRDLVTGPLGLDYHVSLPRPEHHRCARFLKWSGYNEPGKGSDGPSAFLVKAWAQFDPANDDDYNSAQFKLAEIPGVNGHGNARAIATLYAELARGGGKLISAPALARATEVQWSATEPVLSHNYRMGLGFTLNSPDAYMGPNPGAFGHVGAGGSTGLCDPAAGIGFSYAMNLMRPNRDNGPRARRLLDALYSCLS